MESFINIVSKSLSSFKSGDFDEVIINIDKALELLNNNDLYKLNASLYNALYDAYEMTRLVFSLDLFEKNDFSIETFENLKSTLESFTQKEGGKSAVLIHSLSAFRILVRAMTVTFRYLKINKINIPGNKIPISFEVTQDGLIRLYALTNDFSSDDKFASLKMEFDKLFEKERLPAEAYIEMSDQFENEGSFEKNIELLEEAMTVHEVLKSECFLRIGKSEYKLGNYESAVDAFMKARVLGVPKIKMEVEIKECCKFLIRTADSREERNKWSQLSRDY